ncbi:TPA: hypothetical protein N0F65_004141, partial [Lagenidium giganteum]
TGAQAALSKLDRTTSAPCRNAPTTVCSRPLHMTVNDFQIAQLFMVVDASEKLTGDGEGVEILKNEPYDNTDGHGRGPDYDDDDGVTAPRTSELSGHVEQMKVSPISQWEVPRNKCQYTLKHYYWQLLSRCRRWRRTCRTYFAVASQDARRARPWLHWNASRSCSRCRTCSKTASRLPSTTACGSRCARSASKKVCADTVAATAPIAPHALNSVKDFSLLLPRTPLRGNTPLKLRPTGLRVAVEGEQDDLDAHQQTRAQPMGMNAMCQSRRASASTIGSKANDFQMITHRSRISGWKPPAGCGRWLVSVSGAWATSCCYFWIPPTANHRSALHSCGVVWSVGGCWRCRLIHVMGSCQQQTWPVS